MTIEMGVPLVRVTIALAAALLGGACEYDRDTVAAGAYGVARAGSAAPSSRPTAAGAGSQQQAAAGTFASGAAGAAAGAVATPSTMAAGAGAPPSGTISAANSCDMSGRWLSTLHTVTDALGNLQYAHSYLYYEIAQSADTFSITKGMLCGDDASGDGSLAVSVDFRASWAATASKTSFAGRKGTSTRAADGCRIDLEPWYEVKGASVPYYLDPDVALPTADQAASGATPGWEDWDNDGHPGITGTLTGTITGKIFTAPRRWTSAAGVADIQSAFTLPLQWNVETNVMAYDGTPLLASEAARAADAKLHFVQFARLTLDQVPATGDSQICSRIVELAPTLTPLAAGK